MRLTEFRKDQNQYFCKDFKIDEEKGLIVSVDNFNRAVVNKLGPLEDAEEEFGVDLTTLIKALKYGAWFVDKRDCHKFFAMCTLCSKIDGKFDCAQEEMIFNGFMLLDQLFGLGHELKDYGKTWALSKDELNK